LRKNWDCWINSGAQKQFQTNSHGSLSICSIVLYVKKCLPKQILFVDVISVDFSLVFIPFPNQMEAELLRQLVVQQGIVRM
jgi:hypothetical protein